MTTRAITVTIVVTTMLIIGLVAGSGITTLSAASTGLRTGFNSLADYLATAQSPAATSGFGSTISPPSANETAATSSANETAATSSANVASGSNETAAEGAHANSAENNGAEQSQQAQPFHTVPSNQFQPYQNYELGFGLHYPASWQVNEQAVAQRVVKFHAQDGSYFVVHVTSANGETLSQWTTIEVAWLKDRLYLPANATSTEISDINGAGCIVNRLPHPAPLAEQPAVALTYENYNGHQAAKIWTIKNGNVYVLTYVAPDPPTYMSNLNTVMTMIKSFQILQAGNGLLL